MIKVSYVTEERGNRNLYPYHAHKEIEIDCFLSGRGVYSTVDREIAIEPGSVFIFGNNMIHRITHISPDEEMNILKVHFTPQILLEDKQFAGYDNLFFNNRCTLDCKIVPSAENRARIAEVLRSMLDEYTGKANEYEKALTLLLCRLCIILNRESAAGDNTYHEFKSDYFYAIMNAVEYINNNLGCVITIDELAKMANMSKNNFLLLFKRYNALTPYNYIQSKRILKAVDMLRKSDIPVSEIYPYCGFSSAVSFNKAFRKLTNCTPTELRRQFRDKTEINI